jgi:hypothetical protein
LGGDGEREDVGFWDLLWGGKGYGASVSCIGQQSSLGCVKGRTAFMTGTYEH